MHKKKVLDQSNDLLVVFAWWIFNIKCKRSWVFFLWLRSWCVLSMTAWLVCFFYDCLVGVFIYDCVVGANVLVCVQVLNLPRRSTKFQDISHSKYFNSMLCLDTCNTVQNVHAAWLGDLESISPNVKCVQIPHRALTFQTFFKN